MKTRTWKRADGGCLARSVLGCGGKRSATPLWHDAAVEKRRRRYAVPAQSKTWRNFVTSLLFLVGTTIAHAQSYTIDWYKIAGGGGTSTGGVYSVSGTIGQHDAGGPMTGGNYSLTSGFWALISVAQTPGLPNLTIRFVGPNSVVVSWPNTGTYTLLQNSGVGGGGWAPSGYTITTSNGTNSITITPPTGNLFFRLSNP